MFGYIMRHPEDTPALQAKEEARRPIKPSIGKPITTWLQTFTRQLENCGTSCDKAVHMAQNRDIWRCFVRGKGLVRNAISVYDTTSQFCGISNNAAWNTYPHHKEKMKQIGQDTVPA